MKRKEAVIKMIKLPSWSFVAFIVISFKLTRIKCTKLTTIFVHYTQFALPKSLNENRYLEKVQIIIKI